MFQTAIDFVKAQWAALNASAKGKFLAGALIGFVAGVLVG